MDETVELDHKIMHNRETSVNLTGLLLYCLQQGQTIFQKFLYRKYSVIRYIRKQFITHSQSWWLQSNRCQELWFGSSSNYNRSQTKQCKLEVSVIVDSIVFHTYTHLSPLTIFSSSIIYRNTKQQGWRTPEVLLVGMAFGEWAVF